MHLIKESEATFRNHTTGDQRHSTGTQGTHVAPGAVKPGFMFQWKLTLNAKNQVLLCEYRKKTVHTAMCMYIINI